MSIVQCYAPTENAELDEKSAFYSLLDKTLVGVKRSDIIVMMGDFNAQVGNNNQDIEHIMGRHGMPCDKENENGQLLIELCGKHGLVIGGMVFLHKEGHKVTWIPPDKDKQGGNQIDHICISQNWRKSILDARNKRGADIGSDHHMTMGILRIKTQKVIRETINRRRYNLKRLEDTESQKIFKTKVREGASALRYKRCEGVEEKWERIKTTFQYIYENTGQLSDSIKTSSGVRQGCLLSPLLFLLLMDGVLHTALDGKKRGLTWRVQDQCFCHFAAPLTLLPGMATPFTPPSAKLGRPSTQAKMPLQL